MTATTLFTAGRSGENLIRDRCGHIMDGSQPSENQCRRVNNLDDLSEVNFRSPTSLAEVGCLASSY